MDKLLSQISNKLSTKKIIGILSILLLGVGTILLIYLISQTSREYTVKEVLYNINTGELFIVRNEGGQIQSSITINPNDRTIKSGDHLIIQTIQEGRYLSKVYSVDAEVGLIEEFSYNGSVVYYQDSTNFIFDDGSTSFLVNNEEKIDLKHLCRDANYFNDQLLCLSSTGKLYAGDESNLEEKSLTSTDGYYAITFTVNNSQTQAFFAIATQTENPENVIIATENIETIIEKSDQYKITDIPSLLVPKNDGAVLNVRDLKNAGETINKDIKLYSLNEGLQPINNYRPSLLIIY